MVSKVEKKDFKCIVFKRFKDSAQRHVEEIKGLGYTCDITDCFEEFKERMKNERYNVVIMGGVYDDCNAIDVVLHVKRNYPNTFVIKLSHGPFAVTNFKECGGDFEISEFQKFFWFMVFKELRKVKPNEFDKKRYYKAKIKAHFDEEGVLYCILALGFALIIAVLALFFH